MIKKTYIYMMLACFTACVKHKQLPTGPEALRLSKMIDDVSVNLAKIGFVIDESSFTWEIKNNRQFLASFHSLAGRHQADKFHENDADRLAFYDPNNKVIVIKKGASNQLSEAYLAHELIHVYQDQQWGLGEIWRSYFKNPSEEQFNIINLMIEGYAELARQAYEQAYTESHVMRSYLSTKLSRTMDEECLLCQQWENAANWTYFMGLRFFLGQYKSGGWPKADLALAKLAPSSEQILHPAKLSLDQPTKLEPMLWVDRLYPVKLISSSVMGEAFLLNKLLSLGFSEEEAFDGASGWDGDLLQTYRTDSGDEIKWWRIVFDRIVDAQQLEMSLTKLNLDSYLLRQSNNIDWIIGEHPLLINRLRIYMSKHPPEQDKSREAVAEVSTREQERLVDQDRPWMYMSNNRSQIIVGPRP